MSVDNGRFGWDNHLSTCPNRLYTRTLKENH